jgi:signal peptidase II
MTGGRGLRARAADWLARARANPLFALGLAGGAAVALVDQAAKFWILEIVRLPERIGGHIEISGLFDLTFVRNFGASFGMLAGSPAARIILSLVALLVAAGLVHWLPSARRRIALAGVALILGGAIGNLVDRVRFGYVVDFLNFSGFPFPHLARAAEFPFFSVTNGGFVWVFNVADAAINVGVALLILDWALERRKSAAKPG